MDPDTEKRIKGFIDLELGKNARWILLYPDEGEAVIVTSLHPDNAMYVIQTVGRIISEKGPSKIRKIE